MFAEGNTHSYLGDMPHDPVFERLRAARREIAEQAGVPPYVVFHDSTLREIAATRPRTLSELAGVQGVGAAKLSRYGDAILSVLQEED